MQSALGPPGAQRYYLLMNGTTTEDAARQLLGGLSLGQIPVAGSKRRSMAINCGGELYRIGRIPANRPFVIIRDNLRLLYVAPAYANYRYAAKKVFGDVAGYDVDHVLGRKLTEQHGYWYTLVTRVNCQANRSHGSYERPALQGPGGVNLDKFCYTDARILGKLLGIPLSKLPNGKPSPGYSIVRSHERCLSLSEAGRLRHCLGMDGPGVHLDCLHPIQR